MKVYFGCDGKELLENKDDYLLIRDSIKKLGHSITRDWIDGAIERAQQGEPSPRSQYYDETIESILAADVVILEASNTSTSIGHQLTLALNKVKPVLLLSKLPEEEIEKDFLTGADISMLVIRRYTRENVESLIKDFIDNKDWGAKVRFNMFLDKDLDGYLNWSTFTFHRNKTAIVKDAIRAVMDADEVYKKYLQEKKD